MNGQITRLAVAAIVLLASLIVTTTYWQAWAAPELADRRDNAFRLVAEFKVKRGRILAADGRTVLARNVRRRTRGQTLYFRRYPTKGLFAHIVGYSTRARSRTGLEESMNDFLTGANTNLDTVVETTLDKLRGTTIEGNDLVLTLRPVAQRIAYEALGSSCGSVVALEPATGRVLVMASSPTYDPNLVEARFNAIRPRGGACKAPLFNRATQGTYAPGSTFKVVTASAALDTGRFEPSSSFNDPGYCIEYGDRVNNYDTTRPFGRVNLVQAMQYSINSVFCNIGIELTALPIIRYMERFGFYALPPLETPDDERRASGLRKRGRLFRPEDPNQVDPGRLAFGQEQLAITPLQMAMVAATIANDGALMRPQLVERIKAPAPAGKTIVRLKPDELNRAVSRQTAEEVTAMMEAVVAGGTGTAAAIPGIRVAGKTGTAETGEAGRNHAWFIAFAPSDKPRVAIAVVVENTSGTGGELAAPIAKRVLQALMPVPSNSITSG